MKFAGTVDAGADADAGAELLASETTLEVVPTAVGAGGVGAGGVVGRVGGGDGGDDLGDGDGAGHGRCGCQGRG